ncbi:MAG: hypothetical protein ACRDGL_04440, partial [Candidatus Limnocylindrales bacterium]
MSGPLEPSRRTAPPRAALGSGHLRALLGTVVSMTTVLFAAGTLFALPVAAHSGDVVATQGCDTWSVTVTLAHDVTTDRSVDVTATIPGTTGIVDGHYDSSFGQIWNQSGPAVASGTVTLTIWDGHNVEFVTSASLPTPEGCATPTP